MEQSIASICCMPVQCHFLRRGGILVSIDESQGATGRVKAGQDLKVRQDISIYRSSFQWLADM